MKIEELEEILATYKVNRSRFKSRTVENKSLPFMLSTFRELIKDEVPPTQEEFINLFREKYPDLKSRGIIARLKRAYLSYIREYHLGYLLKKHFKTVIYDEKTDIGGIDYVVFYKRRKFNLHAYVNTESGRYWRGVKNSRHEFKGNHLDLPLNLDRGKHCGTFILYTEEDIRTLKREMDATLKSKATLN